MFARKLSIPTLGRTLQLFSTVELSSLRFGVVINVDSVIILVSVVAFFVDVLL